MRRVVSLYFMCMWCAVAQAAPAGQCSAVSGEHRLPIIELYTSEGCDSCPPMDAWFSELPRNGLGPDRLLALAWHVDYWDYIGWRDPYAQARFSERQRHANARNGSRRIYTPQLMVNGRDFRSNDLKRDLAARVEEVGRSPARASIRMSVKTTPVQLAVSGAWRPVAGVPSEHAQGWLALYENRLVTDVRAGENRGRRLQHDAVVRDLAGPFPVGDLSHVFALDSTWKQAELGVAAVVIDPRNGDALQALALTGCRGASS